MGYFDIDGVRYWDRRDKEEHFTPANLVPENIPYRLESDSCVRKDGNALDTQPVEEAQALKEEMEVLQRHDRKLREAVAARRTAGGPKFAPTEEQKFSE